MYRERANGDDEAWIEWVYPYIKSEGALFCPSAETDPAVVVQKYFGAGGYTTGAGFKVATSYYWDGLNTYSYYLTPTTTVPGFPPVSVGAAFYGSMAPCTADPSTPEGMGCARCRGSVEYRTYGCKSLEMVPQPAEAAFLQEGYIVTRPTPAVAGLKFGPAYAFANPFDLSDSADKGLMRHNVGQNLGYADGHVKWVNGKSFMYDYTARTGGAYAGNPQSPYQRVGP